MNKKKSLTEYEMISRHRIKSLINSKCGGSQREFAQKTGLNYGSVSQYVNGKNTPSNISAEKIARAFDVSAEWVMGFASDSSSGSVPVEMRFEASPEMLRRVSLYSSMITPHEYKLLEAYRNYKHQDAIDSILGIEKEEEG